MSVSFRQKADVDLIVERIEDGSWIGIEVKLGSNQIEGGAASLLKANETRIGEPESALLVVTATGYAYRRQDGVYVVQLGMLGLQGFSTLRFEQGKDKQIVSGP
jgi:hypothetical protein